MCEVALRLHKTPFFSSLGPLHTWDWQPMTFTLQALSLVEKVEPVKFASHYAWGTNRVYMWVQDGCKVEWIMFHIHLDYSYKPPLGGRPTTKPMGDHGNPNAHNRSFILFFIMCEDLHD